MTLCKCESTECVEAREKQELLEALETLVAAVNYYMEHGTTSDKIIIAKAKAVIEKTRTGDDGQGPCPCHGSVTCPCPCHDGDEVKRHEAKGA